MKKRLSLLLALVMVFSLFPIHAETYDERAERAGNTLQGYGAVKGGSDGNLMIDENLKRQDAVVILTRLMGKEKEADSMVGQYSKFADIAIKYYEPFLVLAEKYKWVEGKGGNVFGFNQDVTVKEFTAMLLRALGYDTTGKNYSNVMTLANSLSLFKGTSPGEDAKIMRGVAFILMNNTLETAPKGEKTALVYKLGYKNQPMPDKFSVVSAEAVSLKAVDIKFSQPVNESTLNYIQISREKGKHKIAITPFMLDETTVRAVLQNKAAQDTSLDILVANVKSAKQEVVENYNGSVTMMDTTPPEVLSVEAPNPKTLIVKVSEPIDLEAKNLRGLNEFKIEAKALNGKIYNELENELIVELGTALSPGSHNLEVSGLRDFAGFSAKAQDFNINVVEDRDAPTITNAVMLSKTNYTERAKAVPDDAIYMIGGTQTDIASVEFTMPIIADSYDPSHYRFLIDNIPYSINNVSISSDGLYLDVTLSGIVFLAPFEDLKVEIKPSAGLKDAANGDSISGTFSGIPD